MMDSDLTLLLLLLAVVVIALLVPPGPGVYRVEIRASNRQTRGLGERLAVNSVMQGTAADIIKIAMVNIHRRLRDEGRSSRLVLQVHDELLVEAPDAEVSTIKELLRKEMSNAYPLDPPAAVDVGAGDDWNEAK